MSAIAAQALSAQEEAIQSGKKIIHGTVSNQVLRLYEAIHDVWRIVEHRRSGYMRARRTCAALRRVRTIRHSSDGRAIDRQCDLLETAFSAIAQ
jgi:predicted nucleic acid-binding protein